MSKMKMSDLFELPMVVDGYSVESQPSTPTECVVEFVSDIECDSGRDAKYVAHAINNHDRMLEEIAELKGAIESAVRIKKLWLPMGAFSDNPPGNCAEIEALHNMANKFENLLAKLNQEGEEL